MMATFTGAAMAASSATSGSTCWTFGCSSPLRQPSRPSSSAAGWSTLRSAKPSRGPTGTASSPTSRATCTARLTGTRGRMRTRRTTMTLVPTGATRILPTWTLEMAMRTVAIVGRKTSTDRRDRGTSWCDVFPLVGCSPYAALPCHGDKSVAPLVLWLATCRVVCACHGVSKAGLPSRNEPFFLALLLVCPCSRRSRGCQSERRGCVKASVVASVLDRHLPRAYRVEE